MFKYVHGYINCLSPKWQGIREQPNERKKEHTRKNYMNDQPKESKKKDMDGTKFPIFFLLFLSFYFVLHNAINEKVLIIQII